VFFVTPQLNFIVEKQEKHSVKILLWSFFVLFSLCSLPPIISGITRPVSGGYSAIWLAYLYVVGGFIRLYGTAEIFNFASESKVGRTVAALAQIAFGNQVKRIAIYAVSILIVFFIRTGGHHVTKLIIGSDPFCCQFVNYNSPLILLAGIALLDLFSHMQLSRWSAFIRFASPLAFSVYLIQNQGQVWNFLFSGAFSKCSEFPLFVLPFVILTIPLAIYTVCSLVDYVRLKIFMLIHLV